MSSRVLVYHGLGANENSTKHLVDALKANLIPSQYSVQAVSPEGIANGSILSESTALLAFGGGYTTGFAKALGSDGIQNVKDYVLNGGSYLGFGAGGYFGCDFIEFDVGGPLEKFSEREIRFYPGIGRGPLNPSFRYGTHKGACAVPIKILTDSANSAFDAYLDGGCAFYPSDPPKPDSPVKEVVSVANYMDLPNSPAAIVKTVVGQNGITVLSGIHLEYDVLSVVDSEPVLEPLRKKFTESKASQEEAFLSLLKLLRLNTV
ncbi:uncharacterized protein TC_0305 [Aplysia californica]|uniref:Uncharacterized protein TC_0305 n=1 Tax=Aplysia californica TaxID=6500 RepID=A0ABM1W220_APLCA|nr:uncharacterized protein TC_0305 [Aplysia californica]XP_005091071.1 uncharacterized protein TC_0305 [Aplysia californica]XP_035828713.1 uncharacterized protein TC_0305 [Aplysia californica]